MVSGNVLEVIDRDGWRRSFEVAKPLFHVGSDAKCDLVLPSTRGGGVAPRHLQFIENTETGSGYRLVNLGESDILLSGGTRTLSPLTVVEVLDGEQISVGDFTLIYHGNAHHERTQQSQAIEISLKLAQAELHPDNPIDGIINVANMGNVEGVQFTLEIEGLESDMYEVGPAPLLFPRARKNIPFRVYHPKDPRLPAGDHRFMIRAKAPEAYPGESAVISHTLRVIPFYKHSLNVIQSVE